MRKKKGKALSLPSKSLQFGGEGDEKKQLIQGNK